MTDLRPQGRGRSDGGGAPSGGKREEWDKELWEGTLGRRLMTVVQIN